MLAYAFVLQLYTRLHSRMFALLACSWLATTGTAVWAQSLDEINQLLKAGQHAKALDLANRYLASKPKDAQARFFKGIALTGLKRENEAIEVFRKLTEDYPGLPEPYNNLAVIYAQQKQYEKARDALEKAIRTHPAYATAHENLGDIYARLASEAYGKALSLSKTNTSAMTKLAMLDAIVGSGNAPAPFSDSAITKPAQQAGMSKTNIPPPSKAAPDTRPIVEKQPNPENKTTENRLATASVANNTSPREEITATVDAWLAAWSKKDINAYLAHYAKDFKVPGGQSREEWEKKRAQRVGKPGTIMVSYENLTINVAGDHAVVRFRQKYRSEGFSAISNKILDMVRENGKWSILEERVGG